jgi:hypothetical protein
MLDHMHSTYEHFWRSKFWWRWVAANAVAELVGLGTVAVVGFLMFRRTGDSGNIGQALIFAGGFILLGAFEGAVVGVAQRAVLLTRLPTLRGWVRATVVGAVLAWAVGMVPSTLMSVIQSPGATPPEEPTLATVLLLAAALGVVAGPLLAAFQWRSLRKALPGKAAYWLPANAAAWAVGMPIIFLGAQANEFTSNVVLIVAVVAFALLLAGGAVGAIHGRVLLWLLSRERNGGNAA